MAIKHLKPKSREEIVAVLEEKGLDRELLQIIGQSELAYSFAVRFILDSRHGLQSSILHLNGLAEIVRKLKQD